jgi:hypothetical protein
VLDHPVHHFFQGKALGYAQRHRREAQLHVTHVIGGGVGNGAGDAPMISAGGRTIVGSQEGNFGMCKGRVCTCTRSADAQCRGYQPCATSAIVFRRKEPSGSV